MGNILAILESIISAAPEAIDLWNKIAPTIQPKADVSEQDIAAINAAAPAAKVAVDALHAAVATLQGGVTQVAPPAPNTTPTP